MAMHRFGGLRTGRGHASIIKVLKVVRSRERRVRGRRTVHGRPSRGGAVARGIERPGLGGVVVQAVVFVVAAGEGFVHFTGCIVDWIREWRISVGHLNVGYRQTITRR